MLLSKSTILIKSSKKFPSSGFSRKTKSVKIQLLLNKKLKQLSAYSPWKSGTNNSGKIVVKSKGRKLKRFGSQVISYKPLDKSLHFIYSVNFTKSKPFLHSLVFSSSGKYSYVRMSSELIHFGIYIANLNWNKFSFNNSLLQSNLNFKYFGMIVVSLFRLPFMSIVKNLQLTSNKLTKFSRSTGSKSIILKKNLLMSSVVVKLPSGVRKIFSLISSCNPLSRDHLKRDLSNPLGKSKNYIKGFAPRSRGVAKNPVDHPHGGRTKSIRYPRTPWGKTTKFK